MRVVETTNIYEPSTFPLPCMWMCLFLKKEKGQWFAAYKCVEVAANRVRCQQSIVTLILVSCEMHMLNFSLYCPLLSVNLSYNIFSLSNVKHAKRLGSLSLWNGKLLDTPVVLLMRSLSSHMNSESHHEFN